MTKTLNNAELNTIRSAINHAMVERSSYMEAWSGLNDDEAKTVRKRCTKFMSDMETLHRKLFGCASAYQQEIDAAKNAKMVSIFDLAAKDE